MKTFIALFRGLNVGGNNILPMNELKNILENLDLHNVKTYIQSGNAVFQSKEKDTARLSRNICAAIKTSHGFEPWVLLIEREELEKVIDSNAFPEAESQPNTLHVNFLASVPARPDLKAMEQLKKDNERFELKGNVLYVHAPDGIGRSKLVANAEKLLGVAMTGRNWRTVGKLLALAKEYAPQ